MSAAREDELVELAAVVRGHGLGGELLLKLFNPESELLRQVAAVTLRGPTGDVRPYRVSSVRGGGDATLLALEGVSSRDQAEALRGSLVCVQRSALPPLDDDEYYLIDLVGLDVRDQGNTSIGIVEDVIEYPSVQCLVVQTDGVYREVPDLPRYVTTVNVRERFVVVDHLEEIEPVKAPPAGRR